MALNLPDMLKAVFEPIIARVADQVEGGIGQLRTLPPEKPIESFKRFKTVKVSSENVINLSNGDFFTYFKCEDEHYLCLSVQYMRKDDIDIISSILFNYDCAEHRYEECFFMHFTYFLKDFYTIKTSYSDNKLIDLLGLGAREKEPEYRGHEISEIISVYAPLLIFSIGPNSALLTKDNWFLASLIAINCPSVKSKVISNDIVYQAEQLFNLGTINLENIYLSLTAAHHKYIFIEIYRCLEAIYYLPWMIDLKSKVKSPCDAFDMARFVSNSLSWREKERESINLLFKDFPYQELVDSGILSLDFIAELTPSDSVEFKVKLSNLIYNLRNQAVHQEDYEEIKKIKINSRGWVVISNCIYRAVRFLYSKHSSDIKVYDCKFQLFDI